MRKGARVAACDREPVLPPPAEAAIELFSLIAEGRRVDSFGPAPLSWTDIVACGQVTGREFSPKELKTVRKIDGIYRAALARSRSSNGG